MKRAVITTLIVFLFIALIGIAVYFGSGKQAISGFSTLSISNAEMIDNGEFIRIFGVSNGAEQLSFTFSSSQIDSYINDDGYDATKSITGSITMDKQIKRFPLIKKTDQNFIELKTQKVGLFKSCPTLTGYTNYKSITSLSLNKVCFYYKGIGTNAEFSGQEIRDSLVSFNIGGSTGILQPSSGTNTLTLNDGKTRVEWVGDLSNYNQISSPFSYSVLFDQSKFQKLIDDDAYSLYQTEVSRFSSCMGSSSSLAQIINVPLLSSLKTNSQIDSCVNTFNNRVTNLLVDKTSEYSTAINSDGISFTENALEVDLQTADAFPTFIITLPAEKVGIIELSGIPNIVSCVEDKKINSGETFSTSIKVENEGSSDGSFFGSVSCSGDVSGSGIISEKFVKSGETSSLSVQVTGQNTQVDTTKSATCTYTIQDRKSGKTDSCISKLDVEYQSGLICNPNSVKCINSDTLRTCSADGKTYSDKKCDSGCQSLEDGTGQCKGEPPKPPIECKFGQEYRAEGSKFLGIFPGKPAGCYTAGWIYFLIIIVVILLIIAGFVGYKRITS